MAGWYCGIVHGRAWVKWYKKRPKLSPQIHVVNSHQTRSDDQYNDATLGNTFEEWDFQILRAVSCHFYRPQGEMDGLSRFPVEKSPLTNQYNQRCSFHGVYAWILVESVASWVFLNHLLFGKGVWVPASPRRVVSKCQGSCLAMAHSHGGNRFWNAADPKSPFGQTLFQGRISKCHEIAQNHVETCFSSSAWLSEMLEIRSGCQRLIQLLLVTDQAFGLRVDPKITRKVHVYKEDLAAQLSSLAVLALRSVQRGCAFK